MIASGLRKRSLYPQTGVLNYEFDVSFNSTAGRAQFGFSGQNGRQTHFDFISGKLYDYEGFFVHAAAANETISLLGYVNNYQHDYYVNQLPVRISGGKATGAAEWFYIDPTGLVADFNLSVFGERGNLQTTEILYSGITGVGTGYLTNLGTQRLRIFSGASQNGSFRYEFPTGYIYGSVPFSGFAANTNNIINEQEVECLLTTNFGTLTLNLLNKNWFVLTQELIPQINSLIVDSGTSHSFVGWKNLIGEQPYEDEPLLVNFYVKWASGTASGNFTGYWSVQTGLQDTSLLLDVPYYSGITGFSGQFETAGLGSRYLKMNYLNTGVNIVDIWFSGYGGAGFTAVVTGGL